MKCRAIILRFNNWPVTIDKDDLCCITAGGGLSGITILPVLSFRTPTFTLLLIIFSTQLDFTS